MGDVLNRIYLSSLLLLSASFAAVPAFGQESDPIVTSIASRTSPTSVDTGTTREVYAPEYFTKFAPLTAADMVSLLPGFEIRGSDGDERGFGQASLNILINGRRPSSKSSGANEILGRIPADNVIRIEILDGATLDIPGLSGQVANIIAKTGELSGSWNYAWRFEKGSQPQLGDGGFSFSGKRGQLEAVASVNFGQFIFTEDGDETFFDSQNNVTQDRIEKVGFNTERPIVAVNLTLLRDNGHIANLNISGNRRNENVVVQETFTDRTSDSLSGSSEIANGEDRDGYEISGDYSFDVPAFGRDGRLKFIGLHGLEDRKEKSAFTFDNGAPGQITQLFLRDDTETEYIARGEYTWKTGESSDWALSLEGALNVLKSETDLSMNGGDISETAVQVEEDRVQANLTRSWALNAKTNLQASIGAEYSKIDDVLDDQSASTFYRPKGLFSASYALNDTWTLRGEVERSVGQLDFGTFVSTVSLAEGTASRGNRTTPEQSWESEIELQHQNPTGLSGRASVFYNIIEDPIEQLLFDDGTQGPGNLDTNAEVYGITGNLTWVLDDVMKGLRVTVEGTLADSSIKDIITLETRATNRQTLWDYDIEARWDIDGTPFAIEGELEQNRVSDFLRIDEVLQNDLIRPEAELSFIHKDLLGMQWTVKLQNIVDFEFRRQRFVFDETRNGAPLRRELTRRKRGQRISIEITDTF